MLIQRTHRQEEQRGLLVQIYPKKKKNVVNVPPWMPLSWIRNNKIQLVPFCPSDILSPPLLINILSLRIHEENVTVSDVDVSDHYCVLLKTL